MISKKHWKDDVISGFVIFLIALPLSIGISLAAGAPASAGIMGAILGGIIGTLFTGSHIVINGPAAGLIVVVLGAIQSLSDGDPVLGFRRMLAVTVIAGMLQILIGLFKMGRLAFLAPSSVVHGMLSAIGVIILVKQLPVWVGAVPHTKSILGMISEVPDYVVNANLPVAVIGISSFSILLLWNKFGGKYRKILPGPLLAVVVGLVLELSFHFTNPHNITLFDHIYNVGPQFLVHVPENFLEMIIFPSFDVIFEYRSFIAIVSIFLVSSLESLLSSYAVDKLDPFQRKSDLDKDILGKGITNLLCGLLGGYPIISEIVRSSANISNGAKTKWSNFYHGLFILVFVGLFPTLINLIPLSSLAAVLLIIGWNLAHPKHFIEAYNHGKDQFLFFIITLFVTIVEDLLLGIAVGISLEIISHLLRGIKPTDFFHPKLKIVKKENRTVIELDSPAVFLGYLTIQKVLSKIPSNEKIYVNTNEHFVDFTIRELIKASTQNTLH